MALSETKGFVVTDLCGVSTVARKQHKTFIFASPVGAVVKYCDEYVCLCVCLSASISPESYAQPLPIFLCMFPMSVAWSSSGMLTIGRIAYQQDEGDGSAQCDCLVLFAFLCCSLR